MTKRCAAFLSIFLSLTLLIVISGLVPGVMTAMPEAIQAALRLFDGFWFMVAYAGTPFLISLFLAIVVSGFAFRKIFHLNRVTAALSALAIYPLSIILCHVLSFKLLVRIMDLDVKTGVNLANWGVDALITTFIQLAMMWGAGLIGSEKRLLKAFQLLILNVVIGIGIWFFPRAYLAIT